MSNIKIFDDFINKINQEIEDLKQKQIKKEFLEGKNYFIEELKRIFNLGYDNIHSEWILVDTYMQIVFPKDEYEELIKGLLSSIVGYMSYKNKNPEDYQREINRIKNSIDKVKILIDVMHIKNSTELSKYSEDYKLLIKKYEDILKCFNLGLPLTDEEKDFLHKNIIDKNYSLKDSIRIDESVKLEDDTNNPSKSKEILDMTSHAFIKVDVDYIPNSGEYSRLKSIIDAYSENLLQLDIEDIKTELNINKYSYESLLYILKSLLIQLQDKIYDLSRFFDDKSYYIDDYMKNECIEEYQMYVCSFLKLHDYLDEIILEKSLTDFKNSIENDNVVNKVIFAIPNGSDKSYFESEITSISKEYLGDILTLITDFEKGNTSRIKSLTNDVNKIAAYELKDDQIRVVYRRLKDNIYLIVGVFIKKSDNDQKTYDKMFARYSENRTIMEYSEDKIADTKRRIVEYIEVNKRENSRK